ncbi:DUF1294 domain-containing protein [Geomonas propionica]|uniref:DUF1294 domain-containing protein n=1 Tax=Geomonas propionica TaxID=2798582 RepID=A0ABS0YPN8_9BACT|nr:DUF1294 domain-containing protein [Geomonas propionica]MBJ6799888.1 DUF1294 domain-containing protein [Geomonas propionica]
MGYAEAREHRKPPSYLWGPASLLLLAALVRLGLFPAALLFAYLLASLLAFLLYALDKQAALRGMRRVRERTLHLAALLGGWPGAVLAQRALHHKTQKGSFLVLFRLTVLANCAALALYGWAGPGA